MFLFCLRVVAMADAGWRCRTTNGDASSSGANSTVNGYLLFILWSVAVLARKSPFPTKPLLCGADCGVVVSSRAVPRFDDVYAHSAVCRRVSVVDVIVVATLVVV